MEIQQVLAELESMGTAQNRKIYTRHGVGANMFGVSYANLKALKKKIKVNHPLARELWATGNHDARVLATMVADPKKMDDAELEAWCRNLNCYTLSDSYSGLAVRSPLAEQKAAEWVNVDQEWMERAGWLVLAQLMADAALPDETFLPCLETIASDIHNRKNRVKDAMNTALISAGIRNDDLRQKALAIAAQIGKVEVDHGETGCKTPDAMGYIRRTWERKEKGAREPRHRAIPDT